MMMQGVFAAVAVTVAEVVADVVVADVAVPGCVDTALSGD